MNKKTTSNPTQARDFQILITLPPALLRGLQHVAKQHFKIPCEGETRPEGIVAMHCLQFALANPEQLSRFVSCLIRYYRDEGVDPRDYGDAVVENCPQYRHKKKPKNWLPMLR